MYETKISDGRWIAYDIPGNIGWIAYITGLILAMINKVDLISVIEVVPAILMLTGVIELISERIVKLDRILPKIRLYRGFGALTAGGVIGSVVSVIGMVVEIIGGNECIYQIIMLAGAVLCFIFGGLLLKGYKKQEG